MTSRASIGLLVVADGQVIEEQVQITVRRPGQDIDVTVDIDRGCSAAE
ncbi:MAG: hypothetical protein R3C19_19380 [Planctomycetaceae bacterium]